MLEIQTIVESLRLVRKTEVQDLENLMTMTMYENAVDSFSFLTIASVCMGIFRGKFLQRNMVCIDQRETVWKECKHEKDCECTEWIEGRVS